MKKVLLLALYFVASSFSAQSPDSKIKHFINLSETSQSTDPGQSLKYSLQAKKLLHDKTHNELKANVYYQISYAFFNLGNIDSSAVYCHKILGLDNINMPLKAKTRSFLSVVYRKLGHLKKAEKHAKKAIELYSKIKDSTGLADSKINLAKIYNKTGNNKLALKYLMQSLNTYTTEKDNFQQGQLYGIIGNIYMESGQKRKAKKYQLLSIQTLKDYKNTAMYADAVNNYGISLYTEKNYNQALHYFKEAYKVYKNLDKKDAMAAAQQNIGISYVYLGKTNKGLSLLHQSLKYFESANYFNDQISVLTDLGDAYSYTGKAPAAEQYLIKAHKLADSIKNTFYMKETLRLLFVMFERHQNYKKSLHYYKSYIHLRDSLDSKDIKKQMNELEVKYQTLQKEKEIQRLRDQEIIDKNNKRLLTGGIFSSIIIFGLIIFRIQTKRKKNAEIHRQKLLVAGKEKELVEVALQKKELLEKQLRSELEFKNKQLTTHALNMMHKNQLLKEITDHIDDQKKFLGNQGKKELNSIKRQLKQGLNIDKDWDLFKIYFEQINQSFFDKLNKINPKLTVSDIRLSALTKLNLSIKEIATVLNISPQSVKNGKYRLKKKLYLSDVQDLNQFLSEL